jgi:hypothetical protein
VIRIRTTRARLLATAVLGTAVLAGTTGCGGPMQAGAAVVVDGSRTTDGQIQDRVAAVNQLAKQAGVTEPLLLSPSPQLSRVQVNQVVEAAVWKRAAQDLGVPVADSDIAQLKKEMVASARQALPHFTGSDSEAIALADLTSGQPSGVAPAGVDTFIALDVYQQVVVEHEAAKLKVDPSSSSSAPALRADIFPILDKAAAELNVKISPRYGSWNAAQAAISPGSPEWIRAAAPKQQVQG